MAELERAAGPRKANAEIRRRAVRDEHRGFEQQPGDLEGQRQAEVVLARFQGVDGLSGNPEPLGEIGLAPVTLGARNLEATKGG